MSKFPNNLLSTDHIFLESKYNSSENKTNFHDYKRDKNIRDIKVRMFSL